MNDKLRVEAFRLRCQGKSWGEIGATLHLSPQHISRELREVVERGRREPDISEPIKRYIESACSGSFGRLALQVGCSAYWLRKVLILEKTPSAKLRRRLTSLTGLTEEEIFCVP